MGDKVARKINAVYLGTIGGSELDDLGADPPESRNLHGQGESAALQSALEKHLFDWSIQTADVTPFREDSRGFAA